MLLLKTGRETNICNRVSNSNENTGVRTILSIFFNVSITQGLTPCYFMAMLTSYMYQISGTYFQKYIKHMFLDDDGLTASSFEWVSNLIYSYVIKLVFGYLSLPLVVEDLAEVMKLWASTYFYGHADILMMCFVFEGPFSDTVKS